MNAWVLLGIAAAVNATAGILLKQGRVVADGAPILQMALSPWFLGACLCYLGNVFLFAKTLDYLPVSLVYPAYAGAGFALIAVAGNMLFNAVKRTTTYKQDILSINFYQFLFRMFAASLRRYINIGSFQHF